MAQFKGWLVMLMQAMLLAAAGAMFMADAAAQQDRKDLVLKGDATCTRCHNEGDEFPVLSIAKTKHGTLADGRTPSCTSCHGVSEAHLKRTDGKRPKPDITFGKRSTTPMEVRSQACLTCHQGETRIHWQMGAHAAADVSCTSCHQVHAQHDRVRDKQLQTAVCVDCHKVQRAEIRRPNRHPILEGKVACSDCHNPHGTAGPKMLVRQNVNDTCYSCHMEKRGPFLRSHQPVQENCSLCHNPHGTTHPNLLRTRPPFLCQQCHEASSHQGHPASLIAQSTSANTIARGCLNCHTNIHGSNNPANVGPVRTFRR